MGVRKDKDLQAFVDVGRVIKNRIEKYQNSNNENQRLLYRVYLNAYRYWREIGCERGYIHHHKWRYDI